MDLLGTFMVILSLTTLYFSHHILSLWFFMLSVQKLPTGKKCHPVLGHLLQLSRPSNRLADMMERMIKKSQAPFVFWIGPVPVLILIEPKHIEPILGSSKYIDKSFQYRFIHPWLGTGLLTSSGSKWQSHRKMMTPIFHFKILENFMDAFAEKSQILVNELEKEIETAEFNIFPYIGKCTLDIICETALGAAITQDKQSEYETAVCRVAYTFMHRMLSPWLYPDFVLRFTPSGRRVEKCIKILHGMTKKIIQERKEKYTCMTFKENIAPGRKEKKKIAFLDILLENAEKGLKLTDEEIREEIDTFMFQGHTTKAAISWTLQMMASHPDVQDKVYEEQQNIFQGSLRAPTMEELNEMKYLERVIKETLRLYPSIPIIARELKEDVELDNYMVPAGMMVAVIPFFTHREEKHYPNPKAFNPDNFLPEKIASRHPFAYIPFSAGPRNCIGQKFAILEEKMVLSYIIRHYKLHATGEIPTPLPELITRPENGINLKITKRVLSS